MTEQLFPARVGEIARVRLDLFPDCEFWARVADDPADTLIALKPICEAMGLNWDGQRQRLERDSVLSSVTVMITATGTDGKSYQMLSLPLAYINGWLFGVDESRVRSELQQRVHYYRKECFNALWRHFSGQRELSPAPPFDWETRVDARIAQAVSPLIGEVQSLRVAVNKNTKATTDHLEELRRRKRNNLSEQTKREHVEASHYFGGLCSCCLENRVTNPDGTQAPHTEFDHFYANHLAGADATWLICKPCHKRLTPNAMYRMEKTSAFDSYQRRRINRPCRQKRLAFG